MLSVVATDLWCVYFSGGKIFCTTVGTLTQRKPDSVLAVMFNGRHTLCEDHEKVLTHAQIYLRKMSAFQIFSFSFLLLDMFDLLLIKFNEMAFSATPSIFFSFLFFFCLSQATILSWRIAINFVAGMQSWSCTKKVLIRKMELVPPFVLLRMRK